MELVNTVPKINPKDFEEMVNSNMKVGFKTYLHHFTLCIMLINFAGKSCSCGCTCSMIWVRFVCFELNRLILALRLSSGRNSLVSFFSLFVHCNG